MYRREVLLMLGTVGAFSSIPLLRRAVPPQPLLITNAYNLWYNRPVIAEVQGGFGVGYINSTGEVLVAEISPQLLVGRTVKLHRFTDASDHGSPALIKVPAGKYFGHVICCYSNHASPLLLSRTSNPGSIREWEKSRVLDEGRSTYVSLVALPNGIIVLLYTLQERVGKYSSGEWRKLVARCTNDGGDSWSMPIQIAGNGPGTFPYATALAASSEGRCATTYAMYSAATKRHQGLRVVITNDAFRTKTEIIVDLGADPLHNTVPFETKWISENLIKVSYTEISGDGTRGKSRVLTIDVDRQVCLSNVEVDDVAIRPYPGGASLTSSGVGAIYSPPSGGLVNKNLLTGGTTYLVSSGAYSSPAIASVDGRCIVVALKDVSVVNTRNFSASMLIIDADCV